MLKTPVASARIIKVNAGIVTETDDLLAAEEPLEIRLGYGLAHERNQKSISVTMRTPGNDFELALGFLFTEGIIRKRSEVAEIKYCTDFNRHTNRENIVRVELKEDVEFDAGKLQRNFYTSSSCGICGKASIEAIRTVNGVQSSNKNFVPLNASFIQQLPAKLRERQHVFEHTGGLHASALFHSDGELVFLREDIGRHNAVDKIIGAALEKKMLPLDDHVLLLSGRAGFELLQKAAMAGIPVVAAVGAPSGLAVETAKEFDITLIGFLRENRFNIYSSPERIFF
ncbi:MAG: formate dehydrogenase accessory sulfurtransferase FdhD [Bacteroidetes bacterium]|nr:formate dehydrogenase accessory sulfurtransferase FdhD [Bacteroidota bacterium]